MSLLAVCYPKFSAMDQESIDDFRNKHGPNTDGIGIDYACRRTTGVTAQADVRYSKV